MPDYPSTTLPPRLQRIQPGPEPWQQRLYTIIFEHDTPRGKLFDVVLLVFIAISVVAVMLESMEEIQAQWGRSLLAIEWTFTLLFTAEYALRMMCVQRPRRYAFSFFGVVDLLAILPTYLSLIIPGAQGLATVRALRLLRLFRVFKLARFMGEAAALQHVLWQSRVKITVFLLAVIIVTTIVGAAMYLVEGPHNPGFRSIPAAIYWAIVTMATVGYGDIVPVTPLGKMLSALLIIFGYALIVVPTGIVTAEWNARARTVTTETRCMACGQAGHAVDARFCKYCGVRL